MSRRITVTLSDEQYVRLVEDSRRARVPVSELIRRIVAARYGQGEQLLAALDASYGAWTARRFDGESYVEGLRGGLGTRIV